MNSRARLTLAAIALVSTLPVAASYLSFYVWPPEGQVNYGELIAPAPLPVPLTSELPSGRWTLVFASAGSCDAACARALYFMRQVRTAQGEHMDRVERLWLLTDATPPPAAVLAEHPGLVLQPIEGSLAAGLPAQGQILLMDPLGKLMMRFPAEPDAKRMIRDLARLLKYSRIG